MSTRKTKPVVPQQKHGKSHKGRKTTLKQPIPVPDRLKRLFNSLCAQIDGAHFANAIKTCDKILRLSPGDPDALRTKLFLFLHTEQYTSALELIEKDDSDHGFEKAYVHYRVQNEEQARNALDVLKDGSGDGDRGTIHLEAQLCYRQGSYQNAVDLYNQLLDTCDPHSEEHSDILTNLQAAQQHLDFIETGFLRSLDSLPASLRNSIDTLPPPPQQNTSAVAAALAASSSNDGGASKAPTAQMKVRLSRVPKGVVPGVTPPPDPERWLKKSERSTVQQGRSKKKGGGGGGATQGSTGVDYNVGGGGTSTPSGGKGGKGKKKK